MKMLVILYVHEAWMQATYDHAPPGIIEDQVDDMAVIRLRE